MTEQTVVLGQGTASGRSVDGVSSFLGIPYAALPAWAGLFGAPLAAPSWDGVRDASTMGPTPPQSKYLPPMDTILDNPIIPGAEFLNVNVWTPDQDGSGLPVMGLCRTFGGGAIRAEYGVEGAGIRLVRTSVF